MSDLMDLIKTNQPGTSLTIASRIGPTGMVDSGNSSGYGDALEELQRAVGVNHIVQINDASTVGDWTETDNATFDVSADTTDDRLTAKNAAMAFTGTAATDNSQYIQTKVINESSAVPRTPNNKLQMDWRDTDFVGFWMTGVTTGDYGTDGEARFAIVNDGTVSEIIQLNGNTATAHQYVQVDISSFDRNKVEAIRFYSSNANTGEAFSIDEIIRYKYQYAGGPLIGCYFYIKSGTTLTENQNCRWTIDGITAGDASQVVGDLGINYLGEATKTGNASRSNYVMLPGRFIFLAQASDATVAGEGLIFSAVGTVEGVSTGEEEDCFCKGLEAAGETGDWIYCIYDTAGRFIS